MTKRKFELITISLNQLSQMGKAKAFWGKNLAGMNDKLRKSVEAEGRSANN